MNVGVSATVGVDGCFVASVVGVADGVAVGVSTAVTVEVGGRGEDSVVPQATSRRKTRLNKPIYEDAHTILLLNILDFITLPEN